MLKRIFFLSLIIVIVGSVLLGGQAYAFEELKEELEQEEQQSQPLMSLQAVSEIWMLDFGGPWIGGEVEFPIKIDIPGREIEPNYITLEGLYKLGSYGDKEAFQGRGSFKYDAGGDMYTQFGVGYLNIGGFGGLTGLVETGIEVDLGGIKLKGGLVGQRTLLGAIIDEYDDPFWLGLNIGIGF